MITPVDDFKPGLVTVWGVLWPKVTTEHLRAKTAGEPVSGEKVEDVEDINIEQLADHCWFVGIP